MRFLKLAAFALSFGAFVALLIGGSTLAWWTLTETKDAAEVEALMPNVITLLVIGAFGVLFSVRTVLRKESA